MKEFVDIFYFEPKQKKLENARFIDFERVEEFENIPVKKLQDQKNYTHVCRIPIEKFQTSSVYEESFTMLNMDEYQNIRTNHCRTHDINGSKMGIRSMSINDVACKNDGKKVTCQRVLGAGMKILSEPFSLVKKFQRNRPLK